MRSLSLIVCALLLSACSGSDNESARDVAAALPCESVESDEVMVAADAVKCGLSGDDVRVSWFKSADDLEKFKLVAETMTEEFSEFAESESDIVYGSDWAVECPTDALCDLVREKLG